MGWKVKIGTIELAEEDVTMGDIIAVGDISGIDDWTVLDPSSSPKAMTAWVVVAMSRKSMVPVEQAVRFVSERPALEIMNAFVAAVPDAPEEAPESPEPTDETARAAQELMREHARQAAAQRASVGS